MKLKKVLSLIVLFTIVRGIRVSANDVDIIDLMKNEIGVERTENEIMSLRSLERLLDGLGGEEGLPDFYAGRYIDEMGRLVILFTQPNEYNYEEQQIFKENNSYRVESVQYSLEELMRTQDEISRFVWGETFDIIIYPNVTAVTINERDNRVEVYLFDYSEEKVREFKKIIMDSEMIVFRAGGITETLTGDRSIPILVDEDDRVDETRSEGTNSDYYIVFDEMGMGKDEEVVGYANAIVNPGDKYDSRSDSASVGYRVRRNSDGAVGFVTTGHAFRTRGEEVRTTGLFSDFVGNEDGSFTMGQTVIMAGGTSMGIKFGEITNTNFNGTIGGVPAQGQIQTNIIAWGGDSGGIVTNALVDTMGIVRGGVAGTPSMIFSSASRINSYFGLSRF